MWKLKARRHHADHRVTFVVERDGLIDDAAITSEAALPESITQRPQPCCSSPVNTRPAEGCASSIGKRFAET